MNRYVKKPIAIEAVKWKGFNNDEIKDFAGDSVKIEVIREGDADNGIPPSVDCSIETLEGVMKANVGDYIIKGVNGEFYPCKPDMNIITNNVDISFIISLSITSLIISPRL